MKKLIHLTYIIICSLLPVVSNAQVGIGTNAPQPSLILDINGNNTRGALLPRFTIPNLFLANPVSAPKTDLIAVNSYSQSVPAESTADTRGLTYWDGTKWKLIQNADQLKITNTSSGGGDDMSGLLIHFQRTNAQTYSATATSTDKTNVLSIVNRMTEITQKVTGTETVNSDYVKVFDRSVFQPFVYTVARQGEPFMLVREMSDYVFDITYKWEGTVSNGQAVIAVIGYANSGVSVPWTPMREATFYPDANNKVTVKINWKGKIRYNAGIAVGLRLASNLGYKYNQTYEELIVRRSLEAQ